MPESNGEQYQVHCSAAIGKHLEEIQKQARRDGRGEEVLTAIRRILHRLSHDPAEFGEPLYHLPGLQLQVRHATTGPLLIYFAVHKDLPLVFIKLVSLLPMKGE